MQASTFGALALATWASLALALSSVSCGMSVPQPAPTVTAIVVLQGIADSGRDLPRPRLPPGADTNSAAAYYARGVELVRMSANLDSAEMALYWASRLDPSWAEPFFLRGVAMLRAARNDALDALRRTGSERAAQQLALNPRQLQRMDSLFHIAWGRNPFLFSDLDTPPFWGGFRDPSNRAAVAFTAGRFAQAETLFTEVLHQHPDNVLLRIYRARALFYLGRYDGAVVELEAARDTVRRKAEGLLSAVRPSVSMLEFAIGIARVQQDDFPAARAAFERALTVDLSFYWAHARLAGSALALHDTATALSELRMAIRLEGMDPVLRLYDGVVLHGAERQDEAAGQLRRAIELDPYYAEPYYWLALVCRAQHKASEAIQQYREFLNHAPREDPKRASAVRDLTALGSVRGDSS